MAHTYTTPSIPYWNQPHARPLAGRWQYSGPSRLSSTQTGNEYAAPSQPGPSRSRGLNYLRDLHTEISNVQLKDIQPSNRASITNFDKPLPRLPPPPPLPSRPSIPTSHSAPRLQNPSHHSSSYQRQAPLPTPSEPLRPVSLPPTQTSTPQKYFRPSAYLRIPGAPHLALPQSEPSPAARSPKIRRKASSPVDITYVPSSSEEDETNLPGTVTNRSPARRQRATSEQPLRTHITTPTKTKTKARSSKPSTSLGEAVQCSGFTRTGAPCKRLVRSIAPYLIERDPNKEGDDEAPRLVGRYCKDHAGMICEVGGFYWRGKHGKGGAGVWVDFEGEFKVIGNDMSSADKGIGVEFIPQELGQQTQTLLRMTMESRLTEKEMPGFMYAYELRDVQTSNTSFFKVGRTDNVARRIGEWSSRCRTHTPTLRDIFPLSQRPTASLSYPSQPSDLQRKPSAPISYLPGALPHSPTKRPLPAVKRWERLVHLELADRSASSASEEYQVVRQHCFECHAVHREVFPFSRGVESGDRVYEDVVREVVERWGRFIRKICQDEG